MRPYPVVFLLLSDWLAVCTRPRYAQPSPPHRFHARKYGESVHSYSSCTSSCCLLFTYLFLSVVRFDKASFEVSHCPRFKSPDFYLWTPGGGLSPVLSRTDRSLFASATTKGIFIRAIRHFTSGTASVWQELVHTTLQLAALFPPSQPLFPTFWSEINRNRWDRCTVRKEKDK